VYTEASVGTSGDTAILTSPDIDLSALTNPELRFWAHLYSQSAANINLRWEVESGGNWQVLDSLQGDQGTAWIRQVSDLSAYSGQTVRFRFIAIKPSTASVFQGDVALDDFEIAEAVTCPVLAYPFTENFDGASWSTGSGALNGGDLIDVCWSRPLSAGNLWGTGTATTPSANTGPNLDVSGSGNYLYTEASRGNGPAWINTPRIFLDTNLQTPYLYFSYHMYGADIDSLRIELHANGGSWNNLYALAGQQQSAANLPWRQDSVDLSAYHGDTVVIRFRE
jgi:MAM domain.